MPLVLLSDLELESRDNSETEEVISAPRNRVSHRSKRLVHDLKSALSPANVRLEKQKNYIKSVIRSNTKPSFIGSQSRYSVIIGQPGPFGDAKQALDSLKAWELIFSREIMRIIVKHTNTRIQKARQFSSQHRRHCFRSLMILMRLKCKHLLVLCIFAALLG